MVINPYRFGVAYDSDAVAYFAAIVTAGSSISDSNKAAVNAFIVGCKADGIWTPIKSACLLSAAADLTGALVPLVGTAPTNNNFVSGDYSRTTGLLSNGTTKYLNANRASNADPQDNCSMGVYFSGTGISGAGRYIAQTTGNAVEIIGGATTDASPRFRNRASGLDTGSGTPSGFIGMSRSGSTGFTTRFAGTSTFMTRTSATSTTNATGVFASGTGANYATVRILFYWIGEALDLALLDARLATYVAALT